MVPTMPSKQTPKTLKFVVSADSHIIEPYDLWTAALGRKHGVDKVPHRHIGEYQGIPGDYMFTGFDYVKVGDLRQESAGSTEDSTAPVPTEDLPPELAARVRISNSDPAVRLELMASDGVDAELIQGTNMLLAMRIRDTEVLKDCAQVFNDYCADYCSHDPKRLLGSAMIPTHDPKWATRELERVAKRGLRATIINTDLPVAFPPYRKPVYDEFWAAACDLDMPIILHIGTGETRDPFACITPEEKEESAGLLLDLYDDSRRAVANEFIFGGIFDRFRKLQVMFGEYECSWFPHYLFRLRQMQGGMGDAMGIRRVTRLADEYVRDHLWLGYIDDPYFERSWDVIGENKVTWGSDYPHPKNTFPNTQKILARTFANVPERVKAKAAGVNVARLFKLDIPADALATAAG